METLCSSFVRFTNERTETHAALAAGAAADGAGDAIAMSQAAEEAAEEKDQSISMILDALTSVLSAVQSLGAVYADMEPILVGFILATLKEDNMDFTEELLEVCTYITMFCDEISSALWTLWTHLIDAHNAWMGEFVPYTLNCLDNFMSRDSDTFLSNPQYQEHIDAMARELLNPDYASDFEMTMEQHAQVAPKLMEVVLLNGSRTTGACNDKLPMYLQLCMERMSSARTDGLKFMLWEVVMNCIYYNAQISVAFLSAHGVLERCLFELVQWAPRAPRLHDRKLWALGFIALMQLDPAAPETPAVLTAQAKDVFFTILRLLEACKRARVQQDKMDAFIDGEGNALLDEPVAAEVEDDEDVEADEAYLDALVAQAKEAREARDENDAGDIDGLAIDPYEIFTTPLDAVHELVEFYHFVMHMSQLQAYSQILQGLPAESKPALEAIIAEGQSLDEAEEAEQSEMDS